MSSQQLLVILGFVAIGVLFTASLIAYVITRVHVAVFRPEASPGLPVGLFASTAMLFGVSASMHSAYRSVVENRQESLRRSLWLGLLFATAFLVGQGFNWVHMFHEQSAYARPTLFAFTFYLLTALHAAHVLGGFIPLGIVIHHATNREYSSSRSDGVRFCVWYWHYLGAIWIVLLVVMLLSQ
ncbi:MAG TPA: cytochrome c oxidase subunit 3 [Polyangiaceae bacterium]|jgi:cytochrome c oxidase subunit 3|nr:cytochrome c oxidase subunit 3 [Polyangiaceae bacterium]